MTQHYDKDYYLRVVREQRFPSEFWSELGSHSLFGMLVARQHGGYGASFHEFIQAVHTLSRRVGALSYVFLAQNLVSLLIEKHGSRLQVDELLPKLVKGEIRVAMALAEDAAGSDAHGISTHAERLGERYRLTGKKDYVTEAAEVNMMIVVAKTGSTQGSRELSAFLVPSKASGLRFTRLTKMGLDFLGLYSVDLDVYVGSDALIGREGEAWAALSQIFAMDRLALSAMVNGVALRLIEDTCEYASNRVVFGKPIGSNQGVQFPLAEAYIETLASQALVDRISLNFGSDGDLQASSAAAFYHSSKWAYEAADVALQIRGAKGYVQGFEEACFRDLRYYRIGPLSQELSLSLVARRRLGLPA